MATDPVFNWIARRDRKQHHGLERFFFWLLSTQAIRHGEVWMHGNIAASVWFPPGTQVMAPGLLGSARLLPVLAGLCGMRRLWRAAEIARTMKRHRPLEPHFYLAFIAVTPTRQGRGFGQAMLAANLRRIDETGLPAYLENSHPRNTALYERNGFVARANIAPATAPPLVPMSRAGAARHWLKSR